ncbi:hypothetical protein [Spirosoma rigui]|uniref:hypothetical protein n=1 Tax=Spirosoma rigui TaxID=564064 RepID=UPI0009AFC9D4|nr:hypothetical protein [Spirosoma rigui]
MMHRLRFMGEFYTTLFPVASVPDPLFWLLSCLLNRQPIRLPGTIGVSTRAGGSLFNTSPVGQSPFFRRPGFRDKPPQRATGAESIASLPVLPVRI